MQNDVTTQGPSRIANCALFSQDREERIKAEKEQASARVVSTKKIILIKKIINNNNKKVTIKKRK